MQIALKIDVDTLRGTREGVPALVRALQRANAGATFLFSLGPDHTGRAIRRVFRRGFIGKVARTSVLEHYGLRTLMYGTLLPGPDIGRRAGAQMRAARDAGFEVGVHCYDHVAWQDFVAARDAAWTERQMRLALERFAAVFAAAPRVHGAAGWQMNESALALEEQLGFAYASDTRGTAPFMPLLEGRRGRVPQLPTTLPTLDELIGLDGLTAANVHAALLERTRAAAPGCSSHVFTLHAELEGMKLLPVLTRLLGGWQAQGHELVSLATLCGTLEVDALPACAVRAGTVPGRSGTLACQLGPVHT
ncbi:MAG: polysaccharide deacetylase family protein [Gammaproteobacteria bacterium]|nr:polysaccharide deacetylase family protein [Gammaproteobacteria bacterium]MDE2250041.1 polysaccharide deacetylase family protein [Gammaproteobacteria bacterium]